MAAYERNRMDAVETVLESDAVAMALRALLAKRSPWEGTASDLLAVLTNAATAETRKRTTWPRRHGGWAVQSAGSRRAYGASVARSN
jgi:hypothetical protein